jgi:hypothetical protein
METACTGAMGRNAASGPDSGAGTTCRIGEDAPAAHRAARRARQCGGLTLIDGSL